MGDNALGGTTSPIARALLTHDTIDSGTAKFGTFLVMNDFASQTLDAPLWKKVPPSMIQINKKMYDRKFDNN